MVMESLQRLDPPRRLGKLTLLARLGEGGMASVYVASVGDGPLARLAAVKLLRQGAPDHDYRTRFIDEAKVVVRLHHNNIVDVREAGEVDGQLYIAMELIEGRDLADVWDRCAALGRAFPVPLGVYIVREILRGLHYAHTFPGLSLVHRDISPSNVLIDWAGAVRLADFGLATSAMKAAQTIAGVVFGKVGYMAPEQATRDELDGRADVYGCGVVLWELLTGRPLRESGTDTRTVARFEAPRPGELSRRVDPQLDVIVGKALANDRDQRFESAQAFMKALSGWLADHAPQTTQETVADFMFKLFGDARERDHEGYTSLLDALPRPLSNPRPSEDPELELAGSDRRPTRVVSAPRAPTDRDSVSPGTVLAERYRVERTLGRGGMGTVYLAEHLNVGRKVAIKVLTEDWSFHEVVARRFKEEARAASAVGHPNIVEIFDAGELPDRRLYLVMEYLTGRSLYDEVCDKKQLDVDRACWVITEVARAIKAAHAAGIIHRDLKPDNVMLVPRGAGEIVKVLDFGISTSAVRSPEEQRLTRPGHALGTPDYMAPEQAKGDAPTPAADIYSMGVMLYESLCGEPPFNSENVLEVLVRKSQEPAPPLGDKRDDVPAALCKFVHACLEIDPARRPQSADEFLQRLERAMRGDDGGLAAVPEPVGVPAPPDFDRALDDAATDSGEFLAVPADTGRIQIRSHSAALRAARRRRFALGAGTGLAALFVGALWWGLPAEGGDLEIDDQIDEGPRLSTVPWVPPVEDPPPSDDSTAPPDGALAAREDEDTVVPEGGDVVPAVDDRPASEVGRPTPRRRVDEPDSAACVEARDKANMAHARGDWDSVLELSARRGCWSGRHRGRLVLLKTKALFEAKRFADCVRAGERSRDPQVQALVDSCSKRIGLTPRGD